jgi:hypothetical protein
VDGEAVRVTSWKDRGTNWNHCKPALEPWEGLPLNLSQTSWTPVVTGIVVPNWVYGWSWSGGSVKAIVAAGSAPGEAGSVSM